MDKSMTIRAADLDAAAKQWVAGVLHVDLTDEDELTLELHRKAAGAREERREAARHRLLGILGKLDERTRDAPDAELEAAIEEALKFVRTPAGE